MIFATSLPRFKAFLGEACHKTTDLACCTLFLASFLVPATRRSVAAAARGILSESRNAGYLLRFLGCSSAPAVLLLAAQEALRHLAHQQDKRRCILVVDSTSHGQQGQHTENTIAHGNHHKRPAKSKRKQKQVHRKSCHCFVFALLLTPSGFRIPYFLPFYSKQHCELFGHQHLSQASLAAQLIGSIAVPPTSPVVVVGDTAFDAKQIRAACGKRGWSWVVPVNPERVLAGDKPRPKISSLFANLKAQDFHRVSFRLDEGELASLARVSPKRSRSSKHQRTYWVHQRIAQVHSVGEVTLLFSMKNQPTPLVVKVQKVLMSNAVKASSQELLCWYALRWQIEQFFKEMKSYLGMCQYKLGQFRRVQGWVSLCVVAFCYLEWYRGQKLREAPTKEKEVWRRMRTYDLREQICRGTQRADLAGVLQLASTPEGSVTLTQMLETLCDVPSICL